jgi:hypothetical protein
MQVGNVQKLIAIFSQSFKSLGVEVSLEKLEDLAVTIHRAMTVQARHFHTLAHVFNFVDSDDPIRSLAALYHDIVYYQVDMGFAPEVWKIISSYVEQRYGEFFITETISPDDRMTTLTLDIFGMKPGQKLSSVEALNEFLSALVMNKELGDVLPEKDLMLMTLCIEATIPFRGLDADGRSHFYGMEERLRVLVKKYNFDMTEDEIIRSIITAVNFANKDIENFAENDPARFLDNTWKLLPESNAALRLPDVYSIGTYRLALQKMAAFFNRLEPEAIFNQYRGVPPNEEYRTFTQMSRKNIEVARDYLKIKILGISVLEALARATGGDAPLSLFMGDMPRDGISIKRLEYFLPETDSEPWVNQKSLIYRLLESGRTGEASFDMKNAPLTLFVYCKLSPEQIEYHMERAQLFFDGKLPPHDFIMEFPKSLVGPIARASAIMVYTRRAVLMQYADGVAPSY